MTVTPAEQRVLQLLPTHPTLGEIGEQLHISRKFSCSTHTEGLRIARSLGLLPQ
jgi:hypothetical protein